MCMMNVTLIWRITSGIFGLRDIIKKVMTLAVPGIMVWMEKSRCIAVVVKKVSISMRLMELVFLRQYFAKASNVLLNDTNYISELITYKSLLWKGPRSVEFHNSAKATHFESDPGARLHNMSLFGLEWDD